MNNIKCKNEVQIVFGILFIVGLIAILGIGTIDLTQGQTNSTANQTSTPIIAASNSNTTTSGTPSITSPSQKEASNSIKGAITETGEFLGNVTEKVASSKSAGALLNETSDALGKAYVETQKYFSPNK